MRPRVPFAGCAVQSQVPEGECDALVALHSATNGALWRRADDWLKTGLPCTWFGVTCGQGHVLGLDLSDNGLDGSLPTGLPALDRLAALDLASSRRRGGIPPEIGGINGLESLDLSANELTGDVPAELGDLVSRSSSYMI